MLFNIPTKKKKYHKKRQKARNFPTRPFLYRSPEPSIEDKAPSDSSHWGNMAHY